MGDEDGSVSDDRRACRIPSLGEQGESVEWSRKGRCGLLPTVLEQAAGPDIRRLQAIAELERRVVEADGGRLKLEWDNLHGRSGDRVEDFLWWEGERLLGFLGIYGFGESPELAGAPDARRRGIGSALLDAAVPLCRERGDRQPLLVVPRQSIAGKRLALSLGGTLDHSGHHLVLSGEPISGPQEPASAFGRRPSRTCRSSCRCSSRVWMVGAG